MKHPLEETNTVQIAVNEREMLVFDFDKKTVLVFGDGDGWMGDGSFHHFELDSP